MENAKIQVPAGGGGEGTEVSFNCSPWHQRSLKRTLPSHTHHRRLLSTPLYLNTTTTHTHTKEERESGEDIDVVYHVEDMEDVTSLVDSILINHYHEE